MMNCIQAQEVAVGLGAKKIMGFLNRFNNESGFSLIELVIMVMILGITLIPLTSLSINNIRTSGHQIELTRGVMYAEEGMEQVWAFYGDSRAGVNKGYQGIIDGYLSDSFADLNSNLETGYSRTFTVSSVQTLDDVDYINVTVRVVCPTAGTIEMTAMLTDFS